MAYQHANLNWRWVRRRGICRLWFSWTADTYPVDRILNSQVEIQHEATVSKIGDEQLFYLMSRGVNEETARKMIVNGFVDDLIRKLPLEYAVEMNRLIDHEMEGSVG